jgi:hypothetical protein
LPQQEVDRETLGIDGRFIRTILALESGIGLFQNFQH